ncbi:MAG: hypothetical protein PHC34_03235 [Candidatus Gastranaerophilales bacterium]|nr:hypothetical protein [Candidatus Gastranaerophilales bacterium]
MKKINLAIFIALAIIGCCNISLNAMSPTDSTNNNYLKNHGHSPEMIRIIDMQKDRIEQKAVPTEEPNLKNTVWNSKPIKALKHMFRMSDVTMSTDFGNEKIKF